jgi:predicted HTH transcriptional regulator
MLFSDRLEVWNPGTLPPSLTLEMLRQPHGSVPGNPLLAEPLYLTKYIERMGTGTGDMIERCRNAGLPEPEFTLTDGFVATIRRRPERAFEAVGGERGVGAGQVTGQVAGQVTGQVAGQVTGQVAGQVTGQVSAVVLKMLKIMSGEMTRMEIQAALGLKGRANFEERYLKPALEMGLAGMTRPDKLRSSKQRYRTTAAGRTVLENAEKERQP